MAAMRQHWGSSKECIEMWEETADVVSGSTVPYMYTVYCTTHGAVYSKCCPYAVIYYILHVQCCAYHIVKCCFIQIHTGPYSYRVILSNMYLELHAYRSLLPI